MGAAARLDPTQVRKADLSETHTDPMARSIHKWRKLYGIESGISCVYSTESPNEPQSTETPFDDVCVARHRTVRFVTSTPAIIATSCSARWGS